MIVADLLRVVDSVSVVGGRIIMVIALIFSIRRIVVIIVIMSLLKIIKIGLKILLVASHSRSQHWPNHLLK